MNGPIYIIKWKIVRKVQKPISFLRKLMFWRPLPIPRWHYDVEFDTRMPGLLRTSDVVLTNDAITLYINTVSYNHVCAQTVDFIVADNPSPTRCVLMSDTQREKL